MDAQQFLFHSFGAYALMLSATLGPALLVAWLVHRQKKADRQNRMSPLVRDLKRFPGHTLRDQIEERRLDLAWDAALLMLIPSIAVSFLLAAELATGRRLSMFLLAAGATGVIGYCVFQGRELTKRSKELDQWRLGFDAEAAVGQDLDQLMLRGAHVFHDVPGEKFNVDHVVVAAQGVFAVETKGYRKPNEDTGSARATVVYDGQVLQFPDWASDKPLRQTERQARWLSEWLSAATGETTQATPVLALPGWFVELKGRGPVRVFNNVQLSTLLTSRGTQRLTPEQVTRIVHQLEQRCRTVKPTYRALEED